MHIKHTRPILLVFGLVILCLTLGIMLRQTFSKNVPSVEVPKKTLPFKLTSPVFDNNGAIPAMYVCNQDVLRPPLTVTNPPSNTKEFAVVIRDSSTNNQTQWVAWNIPASTKLIAENSLPEGVVQGLNYSNSSGFAGLCPGASAGKHTYIFDLYALSEKVTLDSSANADRLLAHINGKVIAKSQLTGSVTVGGSIKEQSSGPAQ